MRTGWPDASVVTVPVTVTDFAELLLPFAVPPGELTGCAAEPALAGGAVGADVVAVLVTSFAGSIPDLLKSSLIAPGDFVLLSASRYVLVSVTLIRIP